MRASDRALAGKGVDSSLVLLPPTCGRRLQSESKTVKLPIVARSAGESSPCPLEKPCPAAVMRLLDSSRRYGVTGICAPRPGGKSWKGCDRREARDRLSTAAGRPQNSGVAATRQPTRYSLLVWRMVVPSNKDGGSVSEIYETDRMPTCGAR